MADEPPSGEDPVPASGTNAWYHREAPLPGGRWRVRCLFSDHHPDGEAVTEPGDVGDAYVLWTADLDDEGRPVVLVNPTAIEGAPAMWFVGLPDATAPQPTMTLVGFDHDLVPPGTVLTDPAFFYLPVKSEEQVGAIRWWTEEAVVDQVYVAEHHRRTRAATALIYAASAFHQFHGWPGRLHSDGRRTSLGEQLVAGLRHPGRIAPLSDLRPPMDPDGRPQG